MTKLAQRINKDLIKTKLKYQKLRNKIMNRLKKSDYVTEEIKQLETVVKEKVKEERERALAQRCLDKMTDKRKKYLFELLSREFATK